MSDLFGNHIVGFPTRRLIYKDEESNNKTTVLMRDEDSSIKISKRKYMYAAAGDTYSGLLKYDVVSENVVENIMVPAI